MSLILHNVGTGLKYLFKLAGSITYSKKYNVADLSQPGGTSAGTVLTALMGMSATVDIVFKITPRKSTDADKDYTDGTGTGFHPYYNNISMEFEWLYKEVCGNSNQIFEIIDSVANYSVLGTINDLTISRKDDGPNEYNCQLNLIEGTNVSAVSST